MKKIGSRWSLRWALPAAALLGASGVGMGAYASHGLGFIADEAQRQIARASLQQAVQMQLFHAPVLLALGLWGASASAAPAARRSNVLLCLVAALFTAGILLFSGLIYLRVLSGYTGLNFLIPTGGMSLIAAWLLLWPAACLARGKAEKPA